MPPAIMRTAGLIALAALPSVARAQDPVALYPRNYTVLLENDRVRVLDFILRKGDTEVMHSHPTNVVYVTAPFTIRFSSPDGSSRVREAKAGDVLYNEATMHSPLNIGSGDARGVIVEMKEAGSAGTAGGASREGTAGALVTAFTYIHGIPGKDQELKEHLLSLTAPTLAEPGAMRYDLYQSATKPSEFLRYEVWRDAAALEAHKQTPPLRTSFERRQREGWSTEITLWNLVPAR
jgi:quinol monooxygenase YgiN/quercetin dioxygenase-like cupin family protein